jgi:uncharacterized membrane protein YjfL (UPF0719 family)
MTSFLEILFILASVLTFLIFARSVFGWVGRIEGYSLTAETTINDNPAVGVRFGFFLLAAATSFVNLLEPSGGGLKQDFDIVAFYGLVSLLLLIVAREVNDKLILYKLNNDAEVIGKKNTSIAIVEGSSYLGTAFITSGALSNVEAGIGAALVWFAVGQCVLVVLDNIYSIAAPGIQDALAAQNIAAAISLGGFLVAGGMALGAAIAGESYGWVQDSLDVGYFLAIWLLVITVVQFLLNKIFLPGTSLRKELLTDRNVAAGIIEAALFIITTLFYIKVRS